MATAVKEKTEKKKDWLTPVAVVGGAGLLGVGLFLFLRKKGVAAGSQIKAHFVFDYTGAGGDYLLQVSLGHVRTFIFDHIEGATWTMDISLPGPGAYEYDFLFTLPEFIKAGTYDAEALIRTEEMDWLEYYIKAVSKSAVIVAE
uniref:Uncharacterized protein n=2 Tax=viral metagenome TaxID=1070528 RepID=A0A6M3X4Y2_9ZZZZ